MLGIFGAAITFFALLIAIAQWRNGRETKNLIKEMRESTQTFIKGTQELIEDGNRRTQELIKGTQELIEEGNRRTQELIEEGNRRLEIILTEIGSRVKDIHELMVR